MDLADILRRAGHDPAARDELFQLAYEELRVLARAKLRGRASDADHTLNTTALVHETYLKLGADALVGVSEQAHFYSLAARAMRQVIVDSFRRQGAAKRGGGVADAELLEDQIAGEQRGEDLLAIDDALSALTTLDQRLGQIVEWRFFCGLQVGEIARLLGVTERTVHTEWKKAKAWLGLALDGAG